MPVSQRAFRSKLPEGEAILQIAVTFDKLLQELFSKTMTPRMDSLRKTLDTLAGERYRYPEFEGNLPSHLASTAGSIPVEYHSVGTRDVLALALRLTMARYFLKGLDGFLMLDDPFVELDSKRRAAAATLIRSFAEEKQVLFFTCHEEHAEVLGGNRIQL